MNSIRYISLDPVNLKTSYGEYDTLDFDVVFAGRKLRLNNIRFAATIDSPNATQATGALRTDNTLTDFNIDPMTGCHAFIDSISTEFSNAGQNSGIVESLQEYPRYCKMYFQGTQTSAGQNSTASACEMRSPQMKWTNSMLRGGQAGKPTGANVYIASNPNEKANFAVRPRFLLNSVSSQAGEPTISERQVGSVRISIRLSRFSNVFNGNAALNDITSYSLTNCRLLYQTYADDGTDAPMVCRTKANLKQNVNGDAITLAARLPIRANSMTASFYPTADINDALKNTLALPEPPGVNRLEFSFNDSTNSFISYELRDRNTILQRAVQSLNDFDETNDIRLDLIKAGDAYMIGLGWDEFIDLSRQKFSLLLNSTIGSAGVNYTLFSYFHGILQIG
tara:strand:- start:7816 stop:8997 length:1182 start_codon:yes stop_codon:yes gene_type:complete